MCYALERYADARPNPSTESLATLFFATEARHHLHRLVETNAIYLQMEQHNAMHSDQFVRKTMGNR